MSAPRTATRLHVLARATAAATLPLALTGCVRLDAQTELSTDDTVSQHLIVAFAPDLADQLQSQLGAAAGSALDLPLDMLPDGLSLESFDPTALYDQLAASEAVDDLESRFPGQIVLEPYDDGELVGVEITVTDLPLASYSDAAAATSGAFGLEGSIVHTDGQFVVTIPADDTRDPSMLGLSAANLALVGSMVDIEVSFTFPGLVTEAPDGTAEGRTASLELADLLTRDEIRIVASDSPQIYWAPILTWGGIALAGIVILGGATLLVRQDLRARRRSSLPAPDAAHESRIGTLDDDAATEEPPTTT